jgi:hypothetical protein
MHHPLGPVGGTKRLPPHSCSGHDPDRSDRPECYRCCAVRGHNGETRQGAASQVGRLHRRNAKRGNAIEGGFAPFVSSLLTRGRVGKQRLITRAPLGVLFGRFQYIRSFLGQETLRLCTHEGVQVLGRHSCIQGPSLFWSIRKEMLLLSETETYAGRTAAEPALSKVGYAGEFFRPYRMPLVACGKLPSLLRAGCLLVE